MNKNVKPLIGKTIASINTKSVNCWKIKFTDGGYIEVWAENDGPLHLPQIWLDALNDPKKNNPPRKKVS